MNYSTVNCSILQQNIVVYHKETMFYYKMRYFTTESGIRAQEIYSNNFKILSSPSEILYLSLSDYFAYALF